MIKIITDTLREVCLSNNAKIDTESGRDIMAKKILEYFERNNIIFYSNLERHNEQMNQSAEGGL